MHERMNDRKLRIAVWRNYPSGGGKRALFDHVSGLVAAGHYVESWCPPTADQSYLPLSELCNEHMVPMRPLHRGRRKTAKIKEIYQPCLDMNSNLKAMDDHCRTCADQINAGGFDVLDDGAAAVLVAPDTSFGWGTEEGWYSLDAQ